MLPAKRWAARMSMPGGNRKQDNDRHEQQEGGWWNRVTRKYVWDALALSGNPPRVDALGVAIGLFVSLGLPIGSHTFTLMLLRPFVRYNVGLAFAVTWIINPFTIIPIYTLYYYIGSLILGGSQTISIERYREALQPIVHAGHFVAALKDFLFLDLQILKRWAIAASIVSPVSGLAGYLITYRIRVRRNARNVGT
jgi:uncharacterized protein (DUF2062 family)